MPRSCRLSGSLPTWIESGSTPSRGALCRYGWPAGWSRIYFVPSWASTRNVEKGQASRSPDPVAGYPSLHCEIAFLNDLLEARYFAVDECFQIFGTALFVGGNGRRKHLHLRNNIWIFKC